MIPLTLQLENFMSYGTKVPLLDLQNTHLTGFVGQTGHGKTALLEAITWAVWGQCRKPSEARVPHAYILQRGKRRCRVTLTYQLFDETERIYKVSRTYTQTHSEDDTGTIQLQYEQISPTCRNLTGRTVTGTQKTIEDSIGMSYEMFTTTSYLVQDNANRFTTSRPAARKEVLSVILGLQIYQKLAARARARHKEYLQKATTLEEQQKRIQERLSHLQNEGQKYQTVEQQFEVIQQQYLQLQEHEQKLREEVSTRIAAPGLFERADAARKTTLTRMDELRQEITGQSRRIDSEKNILIRSEEITSQYKEFLALKTEDMTLTAKATEYYDTQAALTGLTHTIAANKALLEQDVQQLRNQEQLLNTQLDQLLKEMTQVEREQQIILQKYELEEENLDHVIESSNAILTTVTEKLAGHRLQRETLEETIQTTMLQMEELDHVESVCPVCQRILDTETKAFVIDRLKTAVQGFQQEYTLIESVISDNHAQSRRIEHQLMTQQQDNTTLMEKTIRIKELGRQEDEKMQQLAELQHALEEKQTILEREEYAQTERQEWQALSRLLPAYDASQHRKVQCRLRQIESVVEQYTLLLQAQEHLGEEEERLAHLQKQLNQAQTQFDEQMVQCQEYQQLSDELKTYQELLQAKETEVTRLSEIRDEIQRQRGIKHAIESELNTLQQQRVRDAARKKTLEHTIYLHALLMHVFGRDGLPSKIVQDALPDLEEEVNELLAKLLEGIHIRFETQRESKKGEPIETLQILLGEQPYEMYSGGERYRIDLAIRIGLARLLARRARIPLKFVAIDEGFGGQDVPGVERCYEAIATVAQEFQRLILITHVERLKDLLPTRVNVIKTVENGSTFSLEM